MRANDSAVPEFDELPSDAKVAVWSEIEGDGSFDANRLATTTIFTTDSAATILEKIESGHEIKLAEHVADGGPNDFNLYCPVGNTTSTDGNILTSVFARAEGSTIHTKKLILNTSGAAPAVSWESSSIDLDLHAQMQSVPAATEADLVAGNSLVVDTPHGATAIPAEVVAKASDVVHANNANTMRDFALAYCAIGNNLYNSEDVELGTINSSGTKTDSATFVRNTIFIPIDGTKIVSKYNGFAAFYDSRNQFVGRVTLTANVASDVPAGSSYVLFVFGKSIYDAHKDELVVNVGESLLPFEPFFAERRIKEEALTAVYDAIHNAEKRIVQKVSTTNLFDPSEVEYGYYNASNVWTSSNEWRCGGFVDIVAGMKIVANKNGFYLFFDSSKEPVERMPSIQPNTPVTAPNNSSFVRYYCKNVVDVIILSYGEVVTDNEIALAYKLSDGVRTKCASNNVKGKNAYFYRFGGKGNDWCFVRTPLNYDPDRKKPYPFVICNHGNGTVMDGDPFKTTYTPRTMYLSRDDARWQNYMTETDDESLWYSNPTMEALLNNGYIVCGCQNYGDGLYGNDDCRNACVDFYNHIVNTYNATDYCYMMGCSNGCQTSINAAYLLGGKVRAMAFLYPLCCLVNQYYAYPSHQQPIKNAYGIIGDVTEAQLISATATHDFLHTGVVGNVRVDYFPATSVYYSLGDTTTPAAANAIPFIERLQSSCKVIDVHVCSGNHGDVSHFQPNVVLDFFEKH